ncbi:MAG: DUF4209 domain-containing protein [Burkholderiales bacterium]
MAIEIIPSIKGCLDAVEAGISPFDENNLSFDLEALVDDPKSLTDNERKGCRAEIFGLRFITANTEQRPPWNLYFVPMASGVRNDGTEVYQPDARDMDSEIIQYWQDRSEKTQHPTFRARYADLAWELSRLWNSDHPTEKAIERPRVLAQRAVGAYLDVVEKNLAFDTCQAWRFLGRAMELALYIKDSNLAERARGLVFSYQREQLKSGESSIWQIDDLLWSNRNNGLTLSDAERSELMDWLNASLTVHSNIEDSQRFDPHQALNAAERIGRWLAKVDPANYVTALQTAGSAFEKIAQKADALTAISWLETLNAQYRAANLSADVARVESAIRARADEAHQSMKRLSVDINVPVAEMDAWLDELTAGSADLALARIAVNLMTSEETLRGMVETASANAPLQAHVSISIMGRGGATAATIGSVKDDMPGRLINQAAMIIGAAAPWVHQGLEYAKTRWNVDADVLFAFLAQSPFFPTHTHAILKQGIVAWFADDTVKAIHLLVPQVEAALREILASMGESVLQPSKEAGGLESIGMGKVLSHETFKDKFDATARHHLRALYTHPKGINLRNKIAHGIAGEELMGRGIANWVIHSLLVVRVYGYAQSSRPD